MEPTTIENFNLNEMGKSQIFIFMIKSMWYLLCINYESKIQTLLIEKKRKKNYIIYLEF